MKSRYEIYKALFAKAHIILNFNVEKIQLKWNKELRPRLTLNYIESISTIYQIEVRDLY